MRREDFIPSNGLRGIILGRMDGRGILSLFLFLEVMDGILHTHHAMHCAMQMLNAGLFVD